MQSDQQNYPPASGSQQNPNVPDFFQLDPIPDPVVEKAKKKKKIIFLFLTLTMLVLATVITLIILWIQAEPERRFYRALDNALGTRYVDREYVIEFKDANGKATASVESDFSNVKQPKTRLSYEYVWVDGEDGDTVKSSLKGDQLYINAGSFFGRLTDAPKGLLQNKVNLRQWYETNIDIENITPLDLLLFSPTINTPLGYVLIANFSERERKQVADFIRSENIYAIKSSSMTKLDDKTVTKYSVTMDAEKYAKLSRKVTDPTGVFSRFDLPTDDNQTQPMAVWVDNETDRILKIAYSEEDKYTVEVKYDYPSSAPATIERPQSVKKLNEHVQ